MQYTINVRGRLLDLSQPLVMGILNATPDSFYSGSRKQTEAEIADRANQIVAEGGRIIDVGAFSTRPGADEVSLEEETERLKHAPPNLCTSVQSVGEYLAPEISVNSVNSVGGLAEGGVGMAGMPYPPNL